MRAFVLGFVAMALGCSSPPATPAPAKRVWLTHLDEEHPLVGKIWDVRASRFVDEPTMLARLSGHVLLGEKHDNPDHHALQAEVVRALVAAGQRPVVAFEMFDVEAQPSLDAARTSKDAAALGPAVGWEKSGWPAWSMYRPIAQAALDAGLPLLATGLSRSKVRAAGKDGAPPLDAGPPLGPAEESSLATELRESHCGKLPESMLPRMIEIQRARDTAMARAVEPHASAVLIAGTGHTRTDRGVGHDLKQAVSVAFAEVDRQRADPASYASRWNAAALPFDFVWFTPRANDDDPCAGL